MTFRIDKLSETQGPAVYTLSGCIEPEHVAELYALLENEQRGLCLDLKEVTLVTRSAVSFLMSCEKRGGRLMNCPAYVRRWMEGLRSMGGQADS